MLKKRSVRAAALVLAVALALFVVDAVNIAESSTVTVSATVGTSVTCISSTSTVAFGTLSSAAIASTSPLTSASTSLSCNTGLGCTLTVLDEGNGANPGLATTSPAYIIGSANSSFVDEIQLIAGTEGYGIQASSTSEGSGGSITVLRKYSSSTYAGVGGLERTAQTLASSTVQISNRSVLVTHWAAISGTTQAGIYNDTITYSCTQN